MLKEKKKRPNNKTQSGKSEGQKSSMNDRLYIIHDSHWDKTSLWISIRLFIYFSNVFSEEFVLSSCGTLPYVNSFFYPGGWYEEKCTYGKVFVGLV